MGAMHQRKSAGTRIAIRWSLAIVASLVLFSVVWIGVRAMLARDELLGAMPIANQIGSQFFSDGGDVSAELAELSDRASKAADLTSDPIWRMGEVLPLVGGNLTAFREATALINGLSVDALPPLAALSDVIVVDDLRPTEGQIDISVFVQAQPFLEEVRAAFQDANTSASNIDTSNTIPQIGSAIDQVVDLVGRANEVVGGVESAASLLPSMLGSDQPRSYLLLSLNNAELRASGGLPGAIAVVNANQGRLSLGDLSSATALGQFDSPVLPLTEAEDVLYGEALGTFMHDVNYTPDFARSAELAQAMWHERTGQTVDGVVAIDPIALGYILEATGPVNSESGVSLTSENAARVLLSDVYSLFPDPANQDAFFAEVTAKIFSAVTGGNSDAIALVQGLGRAADENRIHVWSAHEAEQALLVGTAVEGAVPVSTPEVTGYGVYLNDATGAKMDYFLDSAIAIASGNCRNDGRPNFEVRVSLASSAPLDAATSLTEYVTGGGVYGVTPGNIKTNVFVYAPKGSAPYSVTINGQEYAFVAADDGPHSVAGVSVELGPGQDAVVVMRFVGVAGASDASRLQHTPMVRDVETSINNFLDCSQVPVAPVEGGGEQSGA